MKKILFVILVCITSAGLQSCHIGTSGTWINGNIESSERNKIAALNDKLFKALMSDDISGVKSLASTGLMEKSGKQLDTLLGALANIHASDYKVLDEFYVKNTTTNITNTVFSDVSKTDGYHIAYLALNKEMYTSVLVSKGLPMNCLVLAIYGKYNGDWKLNILQVGKYSVLNETAIDNYAAAKEQYGKGNLINAANKMIMAAETGSPAGAFFKYSNEDEMKAFYTKVINEANSKYHFPLTLTQIKTQPQIISETPQYINDKNTPGVYPAVRYKSSINLKDTISLHAENNEIQKVIGSVFKGIDSDTKYILYKAYNQLGDAKTMVDQYGFIQKVK